MRTSLIAIGILAIGLTHCASDRGLFVGEERDPGDGGGGEPGETGGTGSGRTGGTGGASNGGSENTGGTENTGGAGNRGGTGSGAEGGEPSETGGSDGGGTDSGGTDSGGAGAGGRAGSANAGAGGVNDGGRAGTANAGAGAGGTNDGGRAGSANAGAGGTSDTDCEALGREYLQRLAAAQQCSPQLTVEQCTIEMPDDFFCPCKTYVNPLREADIRRLNEILEKRSGCVRVCPAIACPDIKRGVCTTGVIVEPIMTAPGRCTGAT